MNTEKMTGKTIVITGSGSGMGAAMAKEFASREAKVALLDLNEEGLKRLQRQSKITAASAFIIRQM